jgi:ketosteroid isomerase-like protein
LSAEAEITRLLDAWAAAVRAHDLDGAIPGRSADSVRFDVPEPLPTRGMVRDPFGLLWAVLTANPAHRDKAA